MTDVPFFKKAMPRDRYLKIMKNLYFQSNDQDNGTDRLFKIRPIITAFTEKFQAVYCSEKYISVD